MTVRSRILLVAIPLLLIGVLAAGLAWLRGTEAGARWLWSMVAESSGERLSIEHLSGTLDDGLVIEGLRFAGDGATVSVGRLESEVTFSLIGPALVVRRLDATDVTIDTGVAGDAGDGFGRDDLRPLSLPFELRVLQARVDDLVIGAGDEAPTWSASRIDLAGRWQDAIVIDRAVLDADVFTGSVSGRLELDGDQAVDIDVAGDLDFGRDPATRVDGLVLEVGGDLAVIDVGLETASPELGVNGSIADPLGARRARLAIQVPEWTVTAGEEDVRLARVRADVDGWLQGYRVRFEGEFETGFLAGAFQAAGEGDPAGIRFESARADTEPAVVEGPLEVAWGDDWRVDGNLAVERLTPSRWWDAWPEDATLRGRVDLHGDENLWRLDNGRLELPGSDFMLDLDGRFETGEGAARIEAGWTAFAWPPGDSTAQLTSARGSAKLSGRPDDWRLSADLALAAPGYPDGTLALDAEGDATAANARIREGRVLGGRVNGRVDIDWSEAFRLDAEGVVDDVDVGAAWPDLPAVLSANVNLDHDAALARTRVTIGSLRGTFEGAPVEGAADVVVQDGQWRIHALDLEAERLRFRDVVAHEVDATASAARPGRVTARAQILDTGSVRLTDLEVVMDGYPGATTFDLSLRRDGFDLAARLTASRLDAAGDTATAWEGDIQAFDIRRDGDPAAGLRGPAHWRWNDGQFTVDDGCLEFRPSGDLCIEVMRLSADLQQIDVALDAVPLSLTRWLLAHDLELTQRVDGTFEWRRQGGGPVANADLRIGAGEVRVVGGDARLDTGPGRLVFALESGRLDSGIFELPLPGAGRIDLDFEVDDLAFDGTGRLGGRGRVDLDDISILGTLLPGVNALDGRLSLDLSLGGRVADPELDGFVRLEGGRFDFPGLGLRVRQVELGGRVSKRDRLDLDGGFETDEGAGRLGVTLDFADPSALAAELRLAGERLLLADLPDLRVVVAPDLTLGWRDRQWQIDGELAVPEALVTPASAFAPRLSESSDVVVTAGGPSVKPNEERPAPIRLQGAVDVTIGDDVRFESDLASGRLGGAVTLHWKQDAMPVADGTITVAGEVRAYGPVLRMDESKLQFNGGPVNNPNLDIRAVREVYGNTQVRSAGVYISGTARRPDVKAYTRPFTNEERAWTLLITGSDIDYSQGVGGFDIGTYIAPRLYLSYGISLFDARNVVGIRYDLKKGFGIKATTGEQESGVDASYTFEH